MHHDGHGCADYGCAEYGSASDYSVSELPRSFIGISRNPSKRPYRESTITTSTTTTTDARMLTLTRTPEHARTRRRRPSPPRLCDSTGAARFRCACRIGSVPYPPHRCVPVASRSTSGIGQRAPATGSITKSRTLWVTAGYGSTLALQATWSRSQSARCCGAAQLTAPMRRARSARVRPLLPRLLGSTCHIGTGTGLTPPQLQWDWARPCHVCTETGADRHATRRTKCVLMSRRRLLCRPLRIHYGRHMRRAEALLLRGLS